MFFLILCVTGAIHSHTCWLRRMLVSILWDTFSFFILFYSFVYFLIFFIFLHRFSLISRFATPDGRQNSYDFHGIWKSMNVSRILYFFYTLCDRCNTFAHGHPRREQRVESRDQRLQTTDYKLIKSRQ